MRNKIKVHIADDHRILIDGLVALLNTDDEIEIEGYSLTGVEVLKWYEKGKADVLILDINMPELDGIEVLKAFRKRNVKQKTIILSGLSDPKIVQEMIALGATGFIEKGKASEHIIKGVKSVYKGRTYYNEEIKESLFQLYVSEVKIEDAVRDLADEPVTDGEIEVLILIVQQYSTPRIAERLNIHVKTVEARRKSLYKKLKVKNVVGLVMYAVKNNIV